MKKILALLLSVMMLLTACAVAEGADKHLVLSDIIVAAGPETLDLTGLNIEFDVADEGCRLHVDAAGQTYAEIILGLVSNTEAVLKMAGLSSGAEAVYGIDLSVLAANSTDLLGELTESLNPEDMAALLQAVQSGEVSVVQNGANFSIEGDYEALLANSIAEETAEFDELTCQVNGNTVTVPAGEYAVTTVTLDNDTIIALLNMLYTDGEPTNAGDQLAALGAAVTVYAQACKGEHMNTMELNIGLSTEDGDFTLSIAVTELVDAEAYAIALGLNLDDESYAISLTASQGAHDDGWVIPGTNGAIMLTDMSLDEAMSALEDGATAFITDAFGAAVGVYVANQMAQAE